MAIPSQGGSLSMSTIKNEVGLVGYEASLSSTQLCNPQTTIHQNGSVDDGFVSIDLGFYIIINGVYYSTVYVGSNSYITFGQGASNYSGLNNSNVPNIPTLKLSAMDNSYQKVTSGPLTIGGNIVPNTKTIRFEGTASTSGVVGSPNMVWEVTFSANSSNFYVVWGANGRGLNGTGGLTDGTNIIYENNSIFCGSNVSYFLSLQPAYSLHALSLKAGKSVPDAMSEFYGYSSTPAGPEYYNLYVGLSIYGATGVSNYNNFRIIDTTTNTYVYDKYNVIGQGNLNATIQLLPGHEYQFQMFAVDYTTNKYVQALWGFTNPYPTSYTYLGGNAFVQGPTDVSNSQWILMNNPLPGTTPGSLYLYGELTFS